MSGAILRRHNRRAAEPLGGKDSKNDKQNENDNLGKQEWWFRASRRHGVQRGYLQKRLDNAHEAIQIERHDGGNYVNGAPPPCQMEEVKSGDRDGQNR